MNLQRWLNDFRWAVRLSFLFFRFHWSIQTTFKTGIMLSFVNSIFGLLSWFFIGNMFRTVQVASLENYDQSYLAYVMTGSFIATRYRGTGRSIDGSSTANDATPLTCSGNRGGCAEEI